MKNVRYYKILGGIQIILFSVHILYIYIYRERERENNFHFKIRNVKEHITYGWISPTLQISLFLLQHHIIELCFNNHTYIIKKNSKLICVL